MENTTEPHFGDPIKLIVTEEVRSYIYETTKWAKFLSIVGFVLSGLTIMSAFGIASLSSSMAQMPMFAEIGAATMAVIMLLYALLIFYPSLLLYKYATAGQKGILYGDQESFVDSASKLKSLFKFWGIITIVGIALYVIIIVFAIAVGSGLRA